MANAFPTNKASVFAFCFAASLSRGAMGWTGPLLCPTSMSGDVTNGWNVYDAAHEYARLKLDCDGFRICNVNADYSVCASYPNTFVVPTVSGSDQLR